MKRIIEELHRRRMIILLQLIHQPACISIRFRFGVAAKLDQQPGLAIRQHVQVFRMHALLLHVFNERVVESLECQRRKRQRLSHVICRVENIFVTDNQQRTDSRPLD